MKRNLIAQSLLCLALVGCATGYGLGHNTTTLGPRSDPRAGFAEDRPMKISMAYHEFHLVDTTGILLAAFVNAGRAHNARAEAIAAAATKTPNADGLVKVEYEWDPMPTLPGLITDFRLRIPTGDSSISFDGSQSTSVPLSYWSMDLRSEFVAFTPFGRRPIVASLFFGMYAHSMELGDFDAFGTDVTFGTNVSYVLGRNLLASGRAQIGVVAPIMGLITNANALTPMLETELSWRAFASPGVSVNLGASLYAGREFELDRPQSSFRAMANVLVSFGSLANNK